MRPKQYLISFIVIMATLPTSLVFTQYQIPAGVIGGGGGNVSNGSFQISSTVGQTLIAYLEAGSFKKHVGFWRPAQMLTPVEALKNVVPTAFRLAQNFPNPFNPSTTFRFEVPFRSQIRLVIYDVLGRQVSLLRDDEFSAGYHEAIWNAVVASGIYFYSIEAVSVDDPTKRFVDVKKMILVK